MHRFMTDQKIGKVLIVDDEAIMRDMLEIELEEQYHINTASNANQALEILKNDTIDLVISDINMPGMKGYELIKIVKENYPHTKVALITGYNVDDYVRMAKESNISNIISKSTPFNFDEFNSIVYGLVTENIFGLDKYMLPDYTILKEFTLRQTSEINTIEQEVIDSISEFHRPQLFVQILLEEIITNAVYHAPVNKDGKTKYQKHSNVVLDNSEKVKIALGKDSEKYGVSVIDTSGRLSKEQVLFRLDRHIHGEGLLDENGRGLHMSRMYADRLIVNINKNVSTEVIFINYLDEKYKGSKPLIINEI
ncbi:MAG: response regulator [Chitinivibrionales bacterium]|nr:response regulator [Chitinivibrionales bacterium]